MKTPGHIAVYLSAEENVPELIQLIMEGRRFDFAAGLTPEGGALFSSLAIRHFVNEELRHDHFKIAVNGHSLATSSSGEQRRALLQHILSEAPAYIIADNVFESIDVAGRERITALLAAAAKDTLVIQLLYRKSDCLPFIDTVVTVKNKTVVRQESREVFMKSPFFPPVFNGSIPPAYNKDVNKIPLLIEMKNVSVHFDGRPVLHNICWQIAPGEFWHLTGPNGAGKTTLLSMIIGDNVKGYGQELYIFGKKKGTGESVWDIKQQIGYFNAAVADFSGHHSAEQMILSGFADSIGLYTKPSDLQIKLAGEWLGVLGLSNQSQQPFRFFTLCRQRMLLIARAMVKHPPLLILDEPAAALDDENAFLLTSLINKIAAETTTTILYVSHREEPGLVPQKVFELKPSATGSTGIVR